MIGPGTGVAPFRGFIHDIEKAGKQNTFMYELYFGCK